jgi:U3 small nucleolar RNA-associated protein 22
MTRAVLLAATSHDPRNPLAYTRRGPSKVVATRMTRLAKAACKLVKEQGVRLDPHRLFATSLRDYDVLIRLAPRRVIDGIIRAATGDPGAKKVSHFKNLDGRTGKLPLPIARHPVAVLLDLLEHAYGDCLIFFHGDLDNAEADVNAGEDGVIGAIWKPGMQHRLRFRTGLPFNFTTVTSTAWLNEKGKDMQMDEDVDGDVVELNQTAILLEIARIGGDMIKIIEVVER